MVVKPRNKSRISSRRIVATMSEACKWLIVWMLVLLILWARWLRFVHAEEEKLTPCILKNHAECWDLCDDSLAEAPFVEGIILHAATAKFECLVHQTNIKWVQLTQPSNCSRLEWFHGEIASVHYCFDRQEPPAPWPEPSNNTIRITTLLPMSATEEKKNMDVATAGGQFWMGGLLALLSVAIGLGIAGGFYCWNLRRPHLFNHQHLPSTDTTNSGTETLVDNEEQDQQRQQQQSDHTTAAQLLGSDSRVQTTSFENVPLDGL